MSPAVASSELPDFLGMTIDHGRLKLVELLGSGAFGKVYKALSSVDNTYYAVKCMKKEPITSREGVFQAREIKLHKMVSSHPNILTAHKHFIEGKHLFLVLDFCAGGDLFVAITEKRRFHRNTAQVKRAFLQILDAVQYSHSKGVFHRDLKPENILCDAQDNLLLADWGLATQSGISQDFNLGSAYYMSPESISEDLAGTYSSRHSDIWALGIILTNLISGRNPWKTATLNDECFVAFLENRDFILNSLPISKGVNELLKQCFRMHPLARPSISSIRDTVDNLETFFLTDEELFHASSAQRAIAKYYSEPTPENTFSPDSAQDGTLCDDSDTDVSSLDPDEVYLYSSPPFASPKLLDPNSQIPGDSSSIGPSDVSSISESSGPITPASQPVEPIVDVEVPELPEDQNIGESAAFPRRFPGPTAKPPSTNAVKPPAPSIFKKTIRRLKAMVN
ncbi:serine/threonine protein kinase, negative regulator of sexual conjugation and meiosis [Mycena filopes]|nr:serine/threonine protein kinase, negative regulator of sexual conjugation and meiosis [Mycena filopes]